MNRWLFGSGTKQDSEEPRAQKGPLGAHLWKNGALTLALMFPTECFCALMRLGAHWALLPASFCTWHAVNIRSHLCNQLARCLFSSLF